MKRQTTAVDWLEMEIVKLEDTYAIPSKIYELCEKAKEMMELQIIDAYGKDKVCVNHDGCTYMMSAELYFNETFEK